MSDLPRPRKRLTELMLKTALEVPGEKEQERRSKASRTWGFRFFRSPVEVLAEPGRSRIAGIRLAINKLEVSRIGFPKGPVTVLLLLVKADILSVSRVQVTEPRLCSQEKWRTCPAAWSSAASATRACPSIHQCLLTPAKPSFQTPWAAFNRLQVPCKHSKEQALYYILLL